MIDGSQTQLLHERIAEEQNQARVLVITSGKGGVGKSNAAVNLSICLSAAQKRVMLIDADLGLGNLDILMNIKSRHNIRHLISGEKSLEEIICPGPCGVEMICGGSGFEELANLNQFQRRRLICELEKLQTSYDLLVIDTGAGVSDSVLNFCESSDHCIVVTTPEPSAMTDAYAMIKILSQRGYNGRISVLVNMADSIAEGKKTFRQLSDVSGRFLGVAVYEAAILCRDERVRLAVKQREPLVLSYPNCQPSSGLAAMAARLARGSLPNIGPAGFFQKVVNWFF